MGQNQTTQSYSQQLLSCCQHEILKRSEEQSLLQAYKTATGEHKETIRNKLITHNLKFVVYVTKIFLKKTHVSGIDNLESRSEYFLELLNEGILGLAHSIDSYNDFNCRLQTYAYYKILKNIMEYHYRQKTPISLSSSLREMISSLAKAQRTLVARNGIEPSNSELAIFMGTTEKNIRRIKEHSYRFYSLYADDSQKIDFQKHLVCPEIPPEEQYIKKESIKHINHALSMLQTKEQILIKMRFLTDHPASLTQVIDALNITRVDAIKLEETALYKLRYFLSESYCRFLQEKQQSL